MRYPFALPQISLHVLTEHYRHFQLESFSFRTRTEDDRYLGFKRSELHLSEAVDTVAHFVCSATLEM